MRDIVRTLKNQVEELKRQYNEAVESLDYHKQQVSKFEGDLRFILRQIDELHEATKRLEKNG